MDGAEWYRYGIELPRSRWMRSNMVSSRRKSIRYSRELRLTGFHREFVNQAQQHLHILGPGTSSSQGPSLYTLLTGMCLPDELSDDAMESFPQPVMLPPPDMGNLVEIDSLLKMASNVQNGRESVTKFLISGDYISKLVLLVEEAEDLEGLSELHRLSSIMKTIILLNDTSIIEQLMSDDLVLGVMGALECKHIPMGSLHEN